MEYKTWSAHHFRIISIHKAHTNIRLRIASDKKFSGGLKLKWMHLLAEQKWREKGDALFKHIWISMSRPF